MTQIKTILLFIIIGFSACISKSNSQTKIEKERLIEKPANFQGTYSFGADIEKEAVGTLLIHTIDDTKALFYLDICRGAPSYNQGRLYGEIIIKDSIGFYSFSDDDFMNCELTFIFGQNQVKIETTSEKDQCGFGNAVYADHTYMLQNNIQPEFFFTGEGDKIYFKDILQNE